MTKQLRSSLECGGSAARQTRYRRYGAALSVAIALAAVSACGQSGSSDGGDSGKDSTKTVKIALSPGGSNLAAYVARKQGFFKKRGVNVELVQLASSTPALAAVAGGHADLAMGNGSGAMDAAINQKQPLVIVATTYAGIPQRLVVSSKIKKASDLSGTTVSALGPNTLDLQALKLMLAQVGVSPDKVKFTYISAGNAGMIAALKSNRVSAAALSPPYSAIAESTAQAHILADIPKDKAQYPYASIIATPAFASSGDKRLVAVLGALRDAIEYAADHESEIKKILATDLKVEGDVALAEAYTTYTNEFANADLVTTAPMIANAAEALGLSGNDQASLLKKVVNNSAAEMAAE